MSKRKLLLADDSITIQKVVNLTFADEGIEVISVGDGDSAMRKFDEFIPDLVMADVNMPGLNGYEVCRIIKQTDETRDIPVILLVGSFEPFDESEAKDAGADDYLTKPFQSIRQLVNKVTELLNQKQTSTAETASVTENAPAVDHFANTLEFEKEETPTVSEFGDAGMDDEMIETSPANNYFADSNSVFQNETTIDYAKTQPLNADDLKGFDILSGKETPDAEEAAEEPKYTTIAPERTSEPPSFNEEARKMGFTSDYEISDSNYENSDYESPVYEEEKAPVISETEPQTDYYLPTEGEFEKTLTDAETLEPEVSYAPEAPREADFSQTETAETEDFFGTKAQIAEPQPDEIQADETETPVQEDFTGSYETTEEEPVLEESSFAPAVTEETPSFEETAEFEYAPTLDEPVEQTSSFEEAVPETEDKAENEDPETLETPETFVDEPETTASVSPLNFDDGDLLELPPLVEETGIRPLPVEPPKPEPEPVVETVEAPAVSEPEPMRTLSPEIIEAIAAKVAEKLSEKVLKNLAAEVVPEVTEQIIREISEENLKK